MAVAKDLSKRFGGRCPYCGGHVTRIKTVRLDGKWKYEFWHNDQEQCLMSVKEASISPEKQNTSKK